MCIYIYCMYMYIYTHTQSTKRILYIHRVSTFQGSNRKSNGVQARGKGWGSCRGGCCWRPNLQEPSQSAWPASKKGEGEWKAESTNLSKHWGNEAILYGKLIWKTYMENSLIVWWPSKAHDAKVLQSIISERKKQSRLGRVLDGQFFLGGVSI